MTTTIEKPNDVTEATDGGLLSPPPCSTSSQVDKHIECVSDFCGNNYNPGAWADVYERPDGSRYIALGGGWEFYAPHTPEVIEESDSHYAPFLAACDAFEDFGYAKLHWSNILANR
jgi:hypothetical protein